MFALFAATLLVFPFVEGVPIKKTVFNSCPADLLRAGSFYLKIHEGICYRFVTNKKKTHIDASDDCKRAGGTLAMPKHWDTNSYLTAHLSGTYYTPGEVWIGLDDQNVEKSFVWADGEPMLWNNFAIGDGPDTNRYNYHIEDCVALNVNRGTWHDYECSVSLASSGMFGSSLHKPYVCEYNLRDLNTQTTATVATNQGNAETDSQGINGDIKGTDNDTEMQDIDQEDNQTNSPTYSPDNTKTDGEDDTKTVDQNDSQVDGQDDSQVDGQADSEEDSQIDTQKDGQIDTKVDGQDDSQVDGQCDSQVDGQDDSEEDSEVDTQKHGQDDSQVEGQDDTQTNVQNNTQVNGKDDTQIDGKDDSQVDGQYDTQADDQDDTQVDGQDDAQKDDQDDTNRKGTNNSQSNNQKDTTNSKNPKTQSKSDLKKSLEALLNEVNQRIAKQNKNKANKTQISSDTSECPPFACDEDCGFRGYVIGEDGCMVCKCA